MRPDDGECPVMISDPIGFELTENNLMRRAILATAVVVGLGSIPLTAVPAHAEYGAIAWDEGTGKYSASWNQPTQRRADEVAISECGASGCKVVRQIGPKMCGALALSENGKKAGAAFRKDRDAARLAALKSCPKQAGECVVRVADCNK
jgi:uncharacterized protein DUF4189